MIEKRSTFLIREAFYVSEKVWIDHFSDFAEIFKTILSEIKINKDSHYKFFELYK